MKRRQGLWLLWLVGFAMPLSAGEGNHLDMKTDWREECRATLSGVYLEQKSDLESLAANMRSLQDKTGQHRKARADLKKEYDAFNKTSARQNFDAETYEKNTALSHKLLLVEQQLVEFDKQITAMKQSQKQLLTQHHTYVTALKKLFKLRDKDIQYLRSCPEFQDVCPLQAGEKRYLKAILQATDPVIACDRYLNIQS